MGGGKSFEISLVLCWHMHAVALPHTSVCPQVLGGTFLPVSKSVLSHWPWSQRYSVCTSARAAVEPDDQMRIDSCAEACIWMCRFNHLTRDWDLWGEDLCGGTKGKGTSLLRQTHCHLWHLSLSTLYLHAIIPLLCFKRPLGSRGCGKLMLVHRFAPPTVNPNVGNVYTTVKWKDLFSMWWLASDFLVLILISVVSFAELLIRERLLPLHSQDKAKQNKT